MIFLKYYFYYLTKFLYIIRFTIIKDNQILSLSFINIYVSKFIIFVFLYLSIYTEIYIQLIKILYYIILLFSYFIHISIFFYTLNKIKDIFLNYKILFFIVNITFVQKKILHMIMKYLFYSIYFVYFFSFYCRYQVMNLSIQRIY